MLRVLFEHRCVFQGGVFLLDLESDLDNEYDSRPHHLPVSSSHHGHALSHSALEMSSAEHDQRLQQHQQYQRGLRGSDPLAYAGTSNSSYGHGHAVVADPLVCIARALRRALQRAELTIPPSPRRSVSANGAGSQPAAAAWSNHQHPHQPSGNPSVHPLFNAAAADSKMAHMPAAVPSLFSLGNHLSVSVGVASDPGSAADRDGPLLARAASDGRAMLHSSGHGAGACAAPQLSSSLSVGAAGQSRLHQQQPGLFHDHEQDIRSPLSLAPPNFHLQPASHQLLSPLHSHQSNQPAQRPGAELSTQAVSRVTSASSGSSANDTFEDPFAADRRSFFSPRSVGLPGDSHPAALPQLRPLHPYEMTQSQVHGPSSGVHHDAFLAQQQQQQQFQQYQQQQQHMEHQQANADLETLLTVLRDRRMLLVLDGVDRLAKVGAVCGYDAACHCSCFTLHHGVLCRTHAPSVG